MKLDKAAVARIKNATPKKQQKGASSLEYIMLAAVIVVILLFVSTNEGIRTSISEAFSGVFDAAKEAATGVAEDS